MAGEMTEVADVEAGWCGGVALSSRSSAQAQAPIRDAFLDSFIYSACELPA